MEQTATTTKTNVTRTRVSDSIHLDNIRSVITEADAGLHSIRENIRAQLDAIDDVREMLETESLSQLMNGIEELEETIATLQARDEGHAAEIATFQAELDAEKERLTKLWDAYKAQEEELRRMKRDEPLLKERLADRDSMVTDLEEKVARLQGAQQYKDRYQSLLKDHERLADSYKNLEKDLYKRNETIAQLEAKAESLKAHEDHTARLKELERNLSEEKERLAKLYKVYEDTESKLREKEEEASRWREWYDRHRQAFEMVGGAAKYPVD